MTGNKARSLMESILTDSVYAQVSCGCRAFKEACRAKSEKILLFGSGLLGCDCLSLLRKAGHEPVAFVDNNHALWNREIHGVRVLSPMEAFDRYSDSVFIVTVYTSAPVLKQLRDIGVAAVPFPSLAWNFADTFLPYWAVDLPHAIHREEDSVRSAFELWADDASRVEYVAQLAWRTSLDETLLPPHLAASDLYFPPDLIDLQHNEAFVDCGAFDGDTIRRVLDRTDYSFGSITAFEPDPATFPRLEQFIESLPSEVARRIEAIPIALGEKRGGVTFEITGTVSSRSGRGDVVVEAVTLDEALADMSVSWIKIDVEGAEAEVLNGAAGILRRHQPVVTTCLYHQQEHLWRIPILIHRLSGGHHRLFLRRHSDECWELVCYAIPVSRIKGGINDNR